MRNFRRFAFLATVATYFLIFVGGLVRVSGAGMGCPDWPTCFGRWIPPTNISQLPPDIDPGQFNFTLAWIEYINRLIGVSVGLFIAITALWAFFRFRKHRKIVVPALIATHLVMFVGWQGGEMVKAHLQSLMVSVHMGLAFIIGLLMIYVTQQAYYLEKGSDATVATKKSKLGLWIGGLAIISIIQVVVGTQMRTALESIAEKFPFLAKADWIGQLGAINSVHTILGIIVTIVSWLVGARILKTFRAQSILIGQTTWAMMILATLQVAVGAILVLVGVPKLLQVFHLLLSALYVGMLTLIFSAVHHEGRAR
jgi:cytochrome c oxidase assembly protein subunit 15